MCVCVCTERERESGEGTYSLMKGYIDIHLVEVHIITAKTTLGWHIRYVDAAQKGEHFGTTH